MKKRFIALSFVSALALTACGAKKYSPSDYILTMDYRNDFKILQLTDLHIGDKDNQDVQYKFLDILYEDANNPDMVVITGDLFTFASKATAERLFKYLDSKEIPWTVVFGNHDEQCYFSVEWMTGRLNELSKSAKSKCLFKDIQDDNIQGNCNFVINLMDGNNIHDQLFLIDSNRYNFAGYFGYDKIKDNQVKWYEEMVNYTKEQNGGVVVSSLMFYHIPLPEINDAVEKGEVLMGEKREKSCPADINPNEPDLFEKVVELGSTKSMIFGHDHINDIIVKYQGVDFVYGVKSTDRIYHDEDMLGATTITIKNDHSLEYRQFFHTYEEVK